MIRTARTARVEDYDAFARWCGLRVVAGALVVRIPWASLRSFALEAAEKSAVTVEPLVPERHGEVERALGVPIGWLARLCRIPGRPMYVARSSDAVAGVLGYDPERGQTTICQARSSSIAMRLLERLVREVDASPPEFLRIALENDTATSDVLVAAGGQITLRMLRMESEL